MFWVDLEMSGLDEKKCHILEVAVIVTDIDFNELETYQRIVYQPPAVLEAMDDWCKKTHGASGLTKAVATGTPLVDVEAELIDLAKRHGWTTIPTSGSGGGKQRADERIVLCGNSVGNDKRFLDYYLTDFAKFLHYRVVDVSSFKEVYRSKWGFEFKKGDERHRALEDVQASISELRAYLSFVTPPGTTS